MCIALSEFNVTIVNVIAVQLSFIERQRPNGGRYESIYK